MSRKRSHGRASRRSWWLVYQARFDDLITLDDDFVPQNISKARIRGVEGQLGMNLDGWRLQGYSAWL